MKRKKIFITGGAGFIGANLVRYLLDKPGFDLTVYDNLSACSIGNLKRAQKDSKQRGRLKFVKADILDFSRLSRAMRGHDAVVHLAAHTRVVESLKNPQKNFRVNSIGTFNVLEAARKNEVKKVVFASSNAAVGEQTPPINEKMVPKPLSPYGSTKLFGEGLCAAYFNSYGLKTVSLRFANAYGPYSEHKTSVVAKFIRRIRKGKPLEIYGDGKQTRDFIHAEDICQAIFRILRARSSKSGLWGSVFQIATGRETKVIDLAKFIQAYVAVLSSKEKRMIFSQARIGEIRKNYSDIRKAKRLLKFKPRIRLQNGLKNLWHKGEQ